MNELSWALLKGLIPYFIVLLIIGIIGVILARLKYLVKTKINQKIASIKTGGEICPECGGKLIMRNGKYGSFIGCSNFPKCRYTQK